MWFVILGFSSSLIGQSVLTRLVKKYRRNALIILCISGVVAISTILLVVVGVMDMVEEIMNSGENFGFQMPCDLK